MLGGSPPYIVDNDGISVEKHYYQKDENRRQSGVALADSHVEQSYEQDSGLESRYKSPEEDLGYRSTDR